MIGAKKRHLPWEGVLGDFRSRAIRLRLQSNWVFDPTGASIRIGLEDRFDRLDQSGEDLVRIGLGVGTTVFEVALVA